MTTWYVEPEEMHPLLTERMGRDALGNRLRSLGSDQVFALDLLAGRWRETVREETIRQAGQGVVRLWDEAAPGAVAGGAAHVPLMRVIHPEPSRCNGHAVVIVPGGGWKVHIPWEVLPIAEWFCERGFTSYCLQYRLLPYLYPAPLLDVQRAIRIARTRLTRRGRVPGSVTAIGFSAGGFLVAMAAAAQPPFFESLSGERDCATGRPDNTILFYPGTTLDDTSTASLSLFNDPEPPADVRTSISPVNQVDFKTPPAFLFGCTGDTIFPPRHILEYASACDRKRVDVEVHLYTGGRHGTGVAEPHARFAWQEQLDSWLTRVVAGEGSDA